MFLKCVACEILYIMEIKSSSTGYSNTAFISCAWYDSRLRSDNEPWIRISVPGSKAFWISENQVSNTVETQNLYKKPVLGITLWAGPVVP
jgi:hypothetical protein